MAVHVHAYMYNYKPTTAQNNALVTNAVLLSLHEKLDRTKFVLGKYGAKRSNRGGNQTRQRW